MECKQKKKGLTRDEALKKLIDSKYVKSFTWEEYEAVKNETDRQKISDFWNKLTYFKHPYKDDFEEVIIPENYGEGIMIETENGTFYSHCSSRLKDVHRRRVVLELQQFPGNPHTYVEVNGGYLSWSNGSVSIGGYIRLKDGSCAPELPSLKYSVLRVVPSDEILSQPHLWDKYDQEDARNGEIITSSRFLSKTEALGNALFLCLARFAGPLHIEVGSYVAERNRVICTVDENDTVLFNGICEEIF